MKSFFLSRLLLKFSGRGSQLALADDFFPSQLFLAALYLCSSPLFTVVAFFRAWHAWLFISFSAMLLLSENPHLILALAAEVKLPSPDFYFWSVCHEKPSSG